jgi:hypothetical protein
MAKKKKPVKKVGGKKGKPLNVSPDVVLGPIAKFVNKKMVEAGLNASQLAALAGVPVPAVYRFVHHGRNLHVDHVTTLLMYFGVKF